MKVYNIMYVDGTSEFMEIKPTRLKYVLKNSKKAIRGIKIV